MVHFNSQLLIISLVVVVYYSLGIVFICVFCIVVKAVSYITIGFLRHLR